MTVVILQLVTSATCFGLVWPTSDLQSLVSIKVRNVVYRWDPMVYIISMSYIEINYLLKLDAVKLYYLKCCAIMS